MARTFDILMLRSSFLGCFDILKMRKSAHNCHQPVLPLLLNWFVERFVIFFSPLAERVKMP